MSGDKEKPAKRKKRAGSRFPVLRWVALVYLLPGLLYLAWVFSQLGDIEERNLRILGRSADDIAAALEVARTNVANLDGELSASALRRLDERQPYLSLDPERNEASLEKLAELDPFYESIADIDPDLWPDFWIQPYYVPGLHDISLEVVVAPPDEQLGAVVEMKLGELATSDDSSFSPGSQPEQQGLRQLWAPYRQREAQPSQEPAARAEEERRQEAALQELRVRLPTWSALLELEEGETLDVRFQVDVEALLEKNADGAAFEQVILVTREGRVIGQVSPTMPFEDRPGRHHVLNVTRLTSRDPSWFEGDEANESRPLTATDLEGASSSRRVELAGQRYELYCQPFRLSQFKVPEASKPEPTTWSVCGLVSPQRNLKQALAVAPHLAIALLLFLILGVLALPFSKLALMHRRERLHFADVYLLLVATFATLLVLPVLVVDGESYHELRDRQRERLEDLAGTIDRRLDEHLRVLYTELDRYDQEVCEMAVEHGLDAVGFRETQLLRSPWRRLLDQQASGDSGSQGDAAAGLTWLHDLSQVQTSDFVSVFWTDPEAIQIAKATIRDANTPAVSLEHRPYFQAIRDDHAWQAGFGSFYFQTYDSVTTGERSTAMSMASRLSVVGAGRRTAGQPCARAPDLSLLPPDGTYVAAITGRPLWLLEPVLPPGVTFVIIDASGRSLFHSVGSRALKENLFDELSAHDRLQSALFARSAFHFNSRYRTRPHMVFVQPARSVPWTIVTLADAEVVGTVNIEVLGQMVIAVLVYALVLNLLLVLVYAWPRRRGGAMWLWPDREKRDLYRLVCLGSLGASIVFVAFIYRLDGEPLQRVALALPVVAMVFNLLLVLSWRWLKPMLSETLSKRLEPYWDRMRFFRLRRSRAQRGEVSPKQLRWHLACVVAIWLLVAVLPVLALFKAAWGDQSIVLLQMEGAELVEDLEQRAKWLEDEYTRVSFDEGEHSRACILAQRWHELSTLYRAASLFNTRFAAHPDFQCRWIASAGVFLAALDVLFPGFGGSAPEVDRRGEGAPLEGLSWGNRLARFKPIYNPTAGVQRHLREADSFHEELSWRLSDDERGVRLAAPLPPPLDIRSDWFSRPRMSFGVYGVVGVFLLLMALVLWVRWSALRIFFGRIGSRVGEEGYTLGGLREIKRPVIALVPSPDDRQRLVDGAAKVIDLGPEAHEESERRISVLGTDQPDQVVCVNFGEALEVPEERRWKLAQLERLVYDKRCRVVLRTAVSPLEDLFRAEVSRGGRTGELAEDQPEDSIRLGTVEAQRWGRLLSQFVVYPVTAKSPPLEDSDLKRLFETGLPPKGLGRRHEELERELELFAGYYWALWTSCSPDERLVLVHLAQESFVNPKQEPAVRRLLQKGLLKREPRLQLMDDAFELFVRRIQRAGGDRALGAVERHGRVEAAPLGLLQPAARRGGIPHRYAAGDGGRHPRLPLRAGGRRAARPRRAVLPAAAVARIRYGWVRAAG